MINTQPPPVPSPKWCHKLDCVHGCQILPWRQSLSEVERNGFIELQGKRVHRGLMSSKVCVLTEGDGEEFYSNGSKDRAWSTPGRSSDGGKVSGNQHHQPSGSSWSGVYMLVDSSQLTSPNWQGRFQSLQNISKDMGQNIFYSSWRRTKDPWTLFYG